MERLAASFATQVKTSRGDCVLTYGPLDVEAIITSVSDDGAGATAVFIGTTRNTFQGDFLISP
jgi:molybdopterin synthase catalytic subunit